MHFQHILLAAVAGLVLLCSESAHCEPSAAESSAALTALRGFLKASAGESGALPDKAFATTPLTRGDADQAEALLQEAVISELRRSRSEEMKKHALTSGKLSMPFFYRTFGKKPKTGWSLYISMHGGGGAPARINDRQWENQKGLYQLKEGIYLVPRAPTNTWNLWHQKHIDDFFYRLIADFVAFEDVDPDRVYLMGYSAGGDGVYQLAPRMADQFAAAAMMAGHPNETSPIGLRNLPFTIHVGENDAAYRRNAVAGEWKTRLANLHKEDADGYTHFVKLHAGKGHWMDRQDAEAIEWMSKFRRNRYPERIVWKQDDVAHDRFYWLAVKPDDVKPRGTVIASRDGQVIRIEKAEASRITILLSDKFVNLDEEIVVTTGEAELFRGVVPRTIQTLSASIRARGGLATPFRGNVEVTMPVSK